MMNNPELEAKLVALLAAEAEETSLGGTQPPLPPLPPVATAPIPNGMDGVDAKIAAAEARTDTKFAELRGELRRLPGMGTLIATIIAAFGAVLAVLAFAGGRFDSGMSARSLVEQVQTEQRARDAGQDRKLDLILARLPAAKPAASAPKR